VLACLAFTALAGASAAQAADRIYWANDDANSISWANLNGSTVGGTLSLGSAPIAAPNGLAIDSAAGRIYWANYGNSEGGAVSTIGWANLDGSDGGNFAIPGDVVTGPHGVAIDPATRTLYWGELQRRPW